MYGRRMTPVILSLPIADRVRSFAFYTDGVGLDAVGEVADDGVPEPLQFDVNDGLRIMLVPTGGFQWVIGDRRPAAAGTNECVIGVVAETDAEVDRRFADAVAHGATPVASPATQPWGYTATFADPDGHLWMLTAEAP